MNHGHVLDSTRYELSALDSMLRCLSSAMVFVKCFLICECTFSSSVSSKRFRPLDMVRFSLFQSAEISALSKSETHKTPTESLATQSILALALIH